jgi:hypothetical protein
MPENTMTCRILEVCTKQIEACGENTSSVADSGRRRTEIVYEGK